MRGDINSVVLTGQPKLTKQRFCASLIEEYRIHALVLLERCDMRLLITAILVFCCASTALAEKTLFNVGLSGTSNLGNNLEVFGQVNIDPTLPIDNSNIGGSSLFVQRNAETPIRSLSFIALAIPNETLGTVQMEWSLIGNDLYVSRTSAEDSAVTYAGLSLTAPQQPSASFSLGSGAFDHTITYGDASALETVVLKGVSGPDGTNGFLVGTVAPIPDPPSPLCDLDATKSAYVDGDVTALSVVRFANLEGADLVSRLIVELKYDAAAFTATAFDSGADGNLILPTGIDLNFGPQQILPVESALPRGTWSYRCAILDPISGEFYAEDTAEFEIQ